MRPRYTLVMKIDGKEIAANIIEELKIKKQPEKILSAILIGNRPDSKSFLRQKELMAKELGIPFELFQFGDDILEDDLIKEIKKIGDDEEIGGMIVQLPLPKHYNREKILAAVNPKKDVDALTLESQKLVNPLPVEVVKDILGSKKYDIRNKIVAVVGKGFLVGKPIIEWLKQSATGGLFARPNLHSKFGLGLNDQCKELMIFDSKSDLSEIKKADLVISGVGKGGLIKPEMLKPGAGLIDFGYSIGKSQSANGKAILVGDLDCSRLALNDSRLAFYTPTPGGTGPILVAEIFKNFYKLNS